MKLFFKLAAILAGLAPLLCEGQQQPLAGFVFANAIGITAKADVTANGRKLTKNGIEPGMATSGIGLPVGSYQIQVAAPGCETANGPLTIAVGSTPIVAAYLERKIDPRTNVPRNIIRLLQLPAQPQESKYSIQVVSVDPAGSFSAAGGGVTQVLPSLKPVNFDSKTVRVVDAGGVAGEVKTDEKGSYYCFVFRKADGKPGTSLAPQRIYQW